MWYLLAALIVGIIIGLNIPWTIPAILALSGCQSACRVDTLPGRLKSQFGR